MNEPLFTLDTGSEGVRRRFVDPGKATELLPESRPAPLPPRIRQFAAKLRIATAFVLRRSSLRI